jgi:hypothetical protein
METAASLASGTGGKPLGTERLSAFFGAPVRAGESGRMFAREFERAIERSHGDGLRARRLDGLESERRAARHASFGVRPGEEDAAAMGPELERRLEAVTPIRLVPPEDALPPILTESAQTAACAPCQRSESSSLPTGAPLPQAFLGDAPRATTSVASASRVSTSDGQVSGQARPGEAQPIEPLQPFRPGASRVARPVASSAASAPDPAVLERAAEILRQIRLHATPDVQRLTLDLEPAELGRLSVQLALRAGRVTVIVRGESAKTLELLEERETELLTILAERGIEAESLRFELGFRGSPKDERPRMRAIGSPPAPSTPPRSPASRIDTQA